MLAALVAVAVVAVALAVAVVLIGRRLTSCRSELASVRAAAAEAGAARDLASAELDAVRGELAGVRESGTEAAEAAAATVAASEAARQAAERGRTDAEAALSEAAVLAARLVDDGAADPAALWALERIRSERTWRQSVAPATADPSPFTAARHPLWTALEVEVAAVREDVGAVVDLDVDLPTAVSAGASLATLRAAQELLAAAVRAGEETLLRVVADGPDLVVSVESVARGGEPVALAPLPIPPSRLESEPGSVRVRGASGTSGAADADPVSSSS